MKRVLPLLLHDVYRHHASESGFTGPAADRYKLGLVEFEMQLSALAHVLNGCAASGCWIDGERARIAVTVDDGGASYHTLVADRLEALGWRGYCFVTTGFIGRPGFLDAHQLRDLHARGHVIGTHSVTHPTRFAACSPERMRREWGDSMKALEDVLGDRVAVGSVPGGYFSRHVAQAADVAGLEVLFTSEPTTRVERVGRCNVIGRFTVRPGYRATFSSELADLRASLLFREWAMWNAKKLAKCILGAGYPRVTQWISRVSQ